MRAVLQEDKKERERGKASVSGEIEATGAELRGITAIMNMTIMNTLI